MKTKAIYVNYDNVSDDIKQQMDELFKHPKKNYWRRKRLFDFVVSLLGTIVLSPLILIISLLIFIDDPHGSPWFKQIRIGRHGEEFYMYKFRTMVVNAEEIRESLAEMNEADGPAFKIKDDPRITKIGKFLRATSIDEILQLFNVLKGDMSLVGPRPPLPDEVDQYNDYQKLRLTVTPGLTCLWQISDNRNDISFEDWVRMDFDYIKNRTVLTDIKMIFKTARVMLGKHGR